MKSLHDISNSYTLLAYSEIRRLYTYKYIKINNDKMTIHYNIFQNSEYIGNGKTLSPI